MGDTPATLDSMADDRKPTQKTRPKGKDKRTGRQAKPLEIPVPKRDEIEGLLKRAAKPGKS
jgi:hypothetical protein